MIDAERRLARAGWTLIDRVRRSSAAGPML
jgi:hypothetical protein